MSQKSNNLQKYRKFNLLSQQELADKLNLSKGIITLIENKSHYPKKATRIKICEFFGISENQMFGNNEKIIG